jgi:hypothetical protein
MEKTIEDALGGAPLCFFLQGAPGDINPYFAVTPLEEDAVAMRDRTGETLGREAARVAKAIHTEPDAEADLKLEQEFVNVYMRWNAEKWRDAMMAVFGPAALQTFPPRTGQEIPLSVSTVLINRKIAILTMPGEPFVQYQTSWRESCPVRDAFLIGYANGYEGYFPTIVSASLGGYGAANPATWVEIGAGDRMVDAGVISINRMLGHMPDMPEDLRK